MEQGLTKALENDESKPLKKNAKATTTGHSKAKFIKPKYLHGSLADVLLNMLRQRLVIQLLLYERFR